MPPPKKANPPPPEAPPEATAQARPGGKKRKPARKVSFDALGALDAALGKAAAVAEATAPEPAAVPEVFNPDPGSGGYDEQTLADRKRHAAEVLDRLGSDAVHFDPGVWAHLTVMQQAMVLACLYYPKMLARACEMVKMSRSNHYRWMRENPYYAQAIESARAAGVELLAAQLRDRAMNGVRSLILYQGQRIPITDPQAPPVIDPATGEPMTITHGGEEITFRGWEEKVEYDNGLAQWLMGALDKKWAPRSRSDIAADNEDQATAEDDMQVAERAFRETVPDHDGGSLLDPAVFFKIVGAPPGQAPATP